MCSAWAGSVIRPTVPVAIQEPPQPGLFDFLASMLSKSPSRKEHIIEIYAGTEVTRWKTIEGDSRPIKLTDGPAADTSAVPGRLPSLPTPSPSDESAEEKEKEIGGNEASTEDRV